ncbi:MAG: hypothetical protein JXA90_12795 [Planctomycetes bacterium]|nr:hypothetical protein [Planctomycetota bacterium]
MRAARLTLVGDGIENPANAGILLDAAEMFAGDCLFHDRAGLADAWQQGGRGALPRLTLEDLAGSFRPRVAFDNLPGASCLYGFTLPSGPRPALIVGNERRGLARAVRDLADRSVELPMISRSLNCLNVAAAAAVALYYISRGGAPSQRSHRHPEKRRPEVLLCGAADPFELGSSIRSAGALGWTRLILEDRCGVWFGCDRGTRSEGRGAARRGRNPIHVLRGDLARRYAFDDVCVVTARSEGEPLHRAELSRGGSQLLVLPDESAIDARAEDWERLGRSVVFLRIETPAVEFPYRYRLPATIALAEAARQIGRRPPSEARRPRRREPFYDRALEAVLEAEGEVVYLEDLAGY